MGWYLVTEEVGFVLFAGGLVEKFQHYSEAHPDKKKSS